MPAASPNWEFVAGDRVALWLPNSPAWLAALYSSPAPGSGLSPSRSTPASVASEIADILGRSGARLLVLWHDFRHIDFLDNPSLRLILSRSIASRGILIYGSAASPELVKGEADDPLRRTDSTTPRYTGDRGDGPLGSVIFTTSGTTKGTEVLVLHDHYSVIEHARAVAA